MAYNTPPTKNTGDVFTAAEFNSYIRDNFAAGVPDIFTTKGDLAAATGPNAATRLAVGSNGQRLAADSAQATGVKWADDFYIISMIMSGGGGLIPEGIQGDIEVPMTGVLQRVTVLPDQSGTMLAEIWKAAYASYPPVGAGSMCARNRPGVFGTAANLTGTVSKTAGGTTLTGSGTSFTTALDVGDVIEVPGGTYTERVIVVSIASNTSLTIHRAWSYSASAQTASRRPPAAKYQDTSLTDWTLSVTAGDILRFNLEKVYSITRATVSLLVKKS
jgi:hypothetical protein